MKKGKGGLLKDDGMMQMVKCNFRGLFSRRVGNKVLDLEETALCVEPDEEEFKA